MIECVFKFKSPNPIHKPVQVSIALPVKILLGVDDYDVTIYDFLRESIAKDREDNNLEIDEEFSFINDHYEQCKEEDPQFAFGYRNRKRQRSLSPSDHDSP